MTTNELTVTLSEEQARIKAEFERRRGTWGEPWDAILRFDPGFLKAYTDFSSIPAESGKLSAKVRELIFIAVDAAATHMYLPGVDQHIRAALDAGATPAEIMETIELTTNIGIHAMNIGMPILVDVLAERQLLPADRTLTPEQEKLKSEFIEKRGYWTAFWKPILEFAPETFEAFLNMSAVPWETGVLEPKIKELIYIAYDSAATHLYSGGLRLHINQALDYGATIDEIVGTMEIASCIGIHSATTATPILSAIIDERAAATRGEGA